jgi:membrane-associated phospholipid phosphatase
MAWRVPQPVATAVSCAVALAATGLLAFDWPVARTVDVKSLSGFVQLSAHHDVLSAANSIANVATPLAYVLGGGLLVIVALTRQLPRLAVGIPVTMAAATATTEILKHLSADPRHVPILGDNQIGAASWPSGHATATMTLVLCAIVVVPPAWRRVAAVLGVAVALVVSYTALILAWHFPSDVLGGLLVAGSWTWLMLAVAGPEGPPNIRSGGWATAVPQWAVPVSLAGLGAAATLVTGLLGHDRASNGTTMAATAMMIAVLVGSLAGGLLLTLGAAARTPAASGRRAISG